MAQRTSLYARYAALAAGIAACLTIFAQPALSQTLKFDMGPQTAPLAPGYIRVTTDTVYSLEQGYGWEEPADADFDFVVEGPDEQALVDYAWEMINKNAEDSRRVGGRPYTLTLLPDWDKENFGNNIMRYAGYDKYKAFLEEKADAFFRDGVEKSDEMVFVVKTDPGYYTVTLYLGDFRKPHGGIDLMANGTVVASNVRADLPMGRRFSHTLMGWYRRLAFNVDAPEGLIRIRLYGNDRARQEIAARAGMYDKPLSFRSGRKQLSPGGTKPLALGGLFKGIPVLGITVAPHEAPPLVSTHGRIAATSPKSPSTLLGGIQSYNAGDLRTAKESFDSLPSGLPKATALLFVAGHPQTLEPAPIVAEAKSILETHLKQHPESSLASVLLEDIALFEEADYLIAHASEEGAVTPRFKAAALLKQIPEDHPLYPQALVRIAAARAAVDPHRVTWCWSEAERILRELDRDYPGNRYSGYHLHDDMTGWEFTEIQPDPDAPDWANEIHRMYNYGINHALWWFRNRQQPDGSIGGGWGDDVEVGQGWQFLLMLNPAASDEFRLGALKIAEGVWQSGEIDTEAGFCKFLADVEHTAEWTGDSIPSLLYIDYGNPIYLERAMKTVKLMRDLFTGVTSRGHRHFKSWHMSATEIDTWNTDQTQDIPLNGRAAFPGLWFTWYSHNPAAIKIFDEWASAWVEDTLRTDKGKPRGVMPSAVRFKDERFGITADGPWWDAPYGFGTQYHGYIFGMFLRMLEVTGDVKYVEPFRAAVDLWRNIPADAPPTPGSARWAADNKFVIQGIRWLRTLCSYLGEASFEQFADVADIAGPTFKFSITRDKSIIVDALRKSNDAYRLNWPMNTSGAAMTDRIGSGDMLLLHGVSSGDMINPAVTYFAKTQHFAALLLRFTTKDLKLLLYSFEDRPVDFSLRPWRLQVKGTYSLRWGTDADGDDAIDRLLGENEGVLEHRGGPVTISLPPKQVVVVEMKQTKPGAPLGQLPDLAVAPDDISYADGKLTVTVHNVGAADADRFWILVKQGDHLILASEVATGLEYPADLEPRTATLTLNVSQKPTSPVTVIIDPDDDVKEIAEVNNSATWDPNAKPLVIPGKKGTPERTEPPPRKASPAGR